MREGLPFGAVMATAGASVLAGLCGLASLAAPLLTLAILQALWIPTAGAWRHRDAFRLEWRAWWAIGPVSEHAGINTVPLGLAVIAQGLTASAGAPWCLVLAAVVLGLAWVSTVLCVGRFIWSLARHGLVLRRLDGAWFLVPAALLGAAAATSALAGHTGERGATALATLALFGTSLGWLGYWAVAWVALVRVWRFGLGGVPQAPWWIAMGCAGLAAAALGHAAAGMGAAWPLQPIFIQAVVATAVVATILCVPVLAGGAAFLWRRCKFRAPAPWPPTFSTAVFALGCLEAGGAVHAAAFRVLGLGAGYATLAFWAITTIWNLGRLADTRVRGKVG